MMNKATKTRKTLLIAAAAVLVAGMGFGAGMMAKESMAAEDPIKVNEAKSIALANVGVSEGNATFTKAKLDDDGHYDVEFYTNSTEYDFEIDAITGRIIDKEAEARTLPNGGNNVNNDTAGQDPAQQPQGSQNGSSNGNSASVIGVDAAKRAALNHAGVSGATFTKAYLDYDDGVRVYEIEFIAGGMEYDYEINATSGKVREWDKERVDGDDRHYSNNNSGTSKHYDHDDDDDRYDRDDDDDRYDRDDD